MRNLLIILLLATMTTALSFESSAQGIVDRVEAFKKGSHVVALEPANVGSGVLVPVPFKKGCSTLRGLIDADLVKTPSLNNVRCRCEEYNQSGFNGMNCFGDKPDGTYRKLKPGEFHKIYKIIRRLANEPIGLAP